MSETIKIIVPDIGDFADVEVIEVLVSAGDAVQAEQPLITLESDKASMDVPAPQAGRIESVLVAVGDRVSHRVEIVFHFPVQRYLVDITADVTGVGR